MTVFSAAGCFLRPQVVWYNKCPRRLGRKEGGHGDQRISQLSGRRGARRVLGVVLLALILLAACIYLFMQRYVTFTDSGEVRLDLPFFQQEEDEPVEPPPRGGRRRRDESGD